eukprot:365682-Chlamydomonas_euryale.AAC.2
MDAYAHHATSWAHTHLQWAVDTLRQQSYGCAKRFAASALHAVHPALPNRHAAAGVAQGAGGHTARAAASSWSASRYPACGEASLWAVTSCAAAWAAAVSASSVLLHSVRVFQSMHGHLFRVEHVVHRVWSFVASPLELGRVQDGA